jgi:hypothetical protein
VPKCRVLGWKRWGPYPREFPVFQHKSMSRSTTHHNTEHCSLLEWRRPVWYTGKKHSLNIWYPIKDFSSKTCVMIYQNKRRQIPHSQSKNLMIQWLCPNVTDLALKFRHCSKGLQSSRTDARHCWNPLCSGTRCHFSLYRPYGLKQGQTDCETAYCQTVSVRVSATDMTLNIYTSALTYYYYYYY